MNITEVRVRRINTDGKIKGVASITFDNAFVVRDIRIIEGQKGLFVAMPSRKTPDGTFRDVAHPISSAAREQIQSAILKEFEVLKAEADAGTEVVADVDGDVETDSVSQLNEEIASDDMLEEAENLDDATDDTTEV